MGWTKSLRRRPNHGPETNYYLSDFYAFSIITLFPGDKKSQPLGVWFHSVKSCMGVCIVVYHLPPVCSDIFYTYLYKAWNGYRVAPWQSVGLSFGFGSALFMCWMAWLFFNKHSLPNVAFLGCCFRILIWLLIKNLLHIKFAFFTKDYMQEVFGLCNWCFLRGLVPLITVVQL